MPLATARQAVILAAGRGSRMGALTDDRPKPLLTVAGRSLLERQLSVLSHSGVRDAVVVVGYGAPEIEAALCRWREREEQRAGHALRVRTVRQPEPLGTAHALLMAAPSLDQAPFFLLLGDLLLASDTLQQLRRRARCQAARAVLAVHHELDPSAGAEVRWRQRDHRVFEIIEKPERSAVLSPWNNSGVYLLPAGIAARCHELELSERGEYELPDLLALLLREDDGVLAAVIKPPLHVGTPEQLAIAEARLRTSPGEQVPSGAPARDRET